LEVRPPRMGLELRAPGTICFSWSELIQELENQRSGNADPVSIYLTAPASCISLHKSFLKQLVTSTVRHAAILPHCRKILHIYRKSRRFIK
jgi:hypothetical protein